jgi:multidrug efflux pump subunit AcrA (membrane-fusion protein)
MTTNTTTPSVLAAGLAATVLFSAALAGCAARVAEAAPAEADAVRVAVAAVTMGDVAGGIDAGGVVQARTTATIAARILAPVREVRVAPGDRVRRGQTLVVLDAGDLAAGARAARAAALAAERGAQAAAADLTAADTDLTLARARHDRIAALAATRSATAQELDDAIAALRSADARVAAASARALQASAAADGARAASEQARTSASFTTVTAPFDGLVTETIAEPGNLAAPGAPLLRLEDGTGFRLEVRLDESRASHLRHGDRVAVFLGTAATAVEGTVDEISRAVDADARALLVKIALPGVPGLRSGTFGKARLAGPTRAALTVPPAAIVRRGQLTSVFVVEAGVARVRLVDVRDGEVLAGLAESEVVVLSPPAGLTDGRRISQEGR